MSVKKLLIILTIITTLCLSTVTAFADESIADQRKSYQDLVNKILAELYQAYPSSKGAISSAYGYAAFGTTSTKIGFIGSGHGRGIAHENKTNNQYYMNMFEADIGFGLGIQENSLVFVFDNWDAFCSFVNNGWDFGGQANATASDSVSGGSLFAGAVSVAPHIWVYQMAGKGLAVSVTLKGTKFSLNSDLNNPNNN